MNYIQNITLLESGWTKVDIIYNDQIIYTITPFSLKNGTVKSV